MKSKFLSVLLVSVLTLNIGISQDKKPLTATEIKASDNIFMTWNKNTPEQEMKDDIKALAEHGVTINYSNIKRNDKAEITAIKVEYSDKSGSKGAMEVDNQKPINTIKFYRQGDELGFGEPTNSDFLAANFPNGQNFMKQFNFGDGDENTHFYKFTLPMDGSSGKSISKIIIQNDDKKPLVIEDGKTTEGGDDYTAEELKKNKQSNKAESFGNGDWSQFNWGSQKENLNDLNEQMEKMQEQLDDLMSKTDKRKSSIGDEKQIKDLNETKEKLLKAKEEMEKTTKELRKAKSSLKTQKA